MLRSGRHVLPLERGWVGGVGGSGGAGPGGGADRVAVDVPVAFVFQPMVMSAQMGQVRRFRGAVVFPGGGVVEVAVSGSSSAAGEGWLPILAGLPSTSAQC